MSPLFSRNFKYKLLSLILATVIWVYVNMEIVKTDFFYDKTRGNTQMAFKKIPINVLSLPNDGTRSLTIKPQTVSVVLSVPQNLEGAITPKDILAYIREDFLLDGSYETLVRFILPQNVFLVSPENSVQVTMTTLQKKK